MTLVWTLSGVRTKLSRADTHFKVLQGEISEFLATNPFGFIGEYDRPRGQIVVKARASTDPEWDSWAAIAGDCIHNLRSALDHLAHQLLSIIGDVPRIGPGGTAFPIQDSRMGAKGGPKPAEIRGEKGHLRGEVRAFVKGVQPYNRVDSPHDHPLWLLHELDNMDKHRALTLSAAALHNFGLGISTLQDIDLDISFVGFEGTFDDTTELARLTPTGTGPNPQMEMHGSGAISVAFDPTCGPAAGSLLLPTLEELRNYVSNIIEVLRIKALKQAGFE